jgi:peroxiredoxin
VGEWALWIVGALVVLRIVGWWRAPDLPDQAPGFELRDLNGGTVALEDLRGSTVVLSFWASWCMLCRAEIPAFSRFARSHPDVHVIGVAADGTPDELREAVETMGIDYTVLVADEATRAAYNVSTLPTTVVIGPEGDVRYTHSGIMLDLRLAFAVRQ